MREEKYIHHHVALIAINEYLKFSKRKKHQLLDSIN